MPMIEGSTPAEAQLAMRREDRRAAALGFLAAHQHQRGGAVIEAARHWRR